MSALERMGDAIGEALEEHSIGDVLGVLTPTIIMLVCSLMRLHGEDPDKAITIDGGDENRKITIHALGYSSAPPQEPTK